MLIGPSGNNTSGYDLSTYDIYGTTTTGSVPSSKITMLGGQVQYIFGSGTSGCTVTGDTNITLKGGTAFMLYGGGDYGSVGGSTNVTVTGGTVIVGIVGGCGSGTVSGNTNVTITGGAINSNVYGGGWNATVSGTATVTVGVDANITGTVTHGCAVGGTVGAGSKVIYEIAFYDASGGTKYSSISQYPSQWISAGGQAIKPATDPTQTGVSFSGWKKVSDNNNYDFASNVLTAVKLYPGWSSSVAITGYYTDNNGTDTALITTKSVPYGTLQESLGLPATAYAKLSDNTTYVEVTIEWTVASYDENNAGDYTATGTVSGTFAGGQVPTARTITVTVTPYVPSSEGSSVEILVNGKTESAATATTKQDGDKTVTTVVLDDKKVEEKLQAVGNNVTITIPVKNDADVVVGQLNGQTVKNMETKEAVLEIKTENVTYTLPAAQINIDNVSEQMGAKVELKDIKVNVTISAQTQDTVKIVEDTANKNNYQVVVKPIEFSITCSIGDKTVEVSKFNGYVEMLVAIPDGIDPSKITTGIVLNSDGTFSHVPTVITIINGRYYAKISSLTNSTYSVIWSPRTFKDVEKYWAKDAVNDMGSRLVINGVGNDMFDPDRDITRGEFAAIVVRALGLMRTGTGKASFEDVSKNDCYFDAVSIAYENGIISGYGNGKFGPNDKITREQAMMMIARAMKITKLKVDFETGEAEELLAAYGDTEMASSLAMDSIASCIKAGVVSGRDGNLVAPKDNITRAEVATIVQRLLKKSKLI